MAASKPNKPQNDSTTPNTEGAPPAGDDQGSGEGARPTAPAGAGEDEKEKARIEAQKRDMAAKRDAEREDAVKTLEASLAGEKKKVAELEEKLKSKTSENEQLKKERDAFLGKLQQQAVGTLDLEKGQAQLTESVTIIDVTNRRIDARLGDVLVVGKPADAKELQDKLGKEHKVYAVTREMLNEVVELKAANVAK